MRSAPSSMTRIAPLSPLCRKTSASSGRPSRQTGTLSDEIHRRSRLDGDRTCAKCRGPSRCPQYIPADHRVLSSCRSGCPTSTTAFFRADRHRPPFCIRPIRATASGAKVAKVRLGLCCSFGIALSTNRKNRVLRVSASTDTCDVGTGDPEGSPFASWGPFRKDRVLRLQDLKALTPPY
jgi:hypothetical protein